MKLIIIVFLIGLTKNSFGQKQGTINYLLVRFEANFDNTNKKNFYQINAEIGCDTAEKIYSLKKYDYRKNAINSGGSFYYQEKDATNNLYNYFLSPTEALNFLSRLGWSLFSIYTEVYSGYDNQRKSTGEIIPITTVSSNTVFCFKM